MRQNPERLAWTVLWFAFITFCLSIVGCWLSASNYLLNSRQGLRAHLNAQRGIVRVEQRGSNRAQAIGLDDSFPFRLFQGDDIRTGVLDEGLLTLERKDQERQETLGTVKVYENSDITLVDASSPRFGFSSGIHTAILQIKGGRVRIEVQPADDGRPVQIEVRTDHARIQLDQGSYVLEVTNQQTATIVRHGQASVRVGEQELVLGDEQRASVSLEGKIDGPLPAARNLIVNGDFSQGETGWVENIDASDPGDRIVIAQEDEQSFAQFQHDQLQPSEVSLIQTLNRNVSDLESLALHLKVRVNSHSLSVCGDKGTECPVMVSIDYIDAAGGENLRQWVHGFYAFEDPGLIGQLPYYCLTCPQPSSGNHNQIAAGAWFLYDSPNLMEILPPEFRPARIQSIRIYASGHIYDSMVTNVELLAQE